MELFTEKAKALDTLKKIKVAIKLKLGKQIKCVHFDRGGEYYGWYDEIGRKPGSFARYLQECGIEASYTMLGTLE